MLSPCRSFDFFSLFCFLIIIEVYHFYFYSIVCIWVLLFKCIISQLPLKRKFLASINHFIISLLFKNLCKHSREKRQMKAEDEEEREWRGREDEVGWGGLGRKRGGCGRFFTWRQEKAEEPAGSAGSSRARHNSRKALSTMIHYSAPSTISLCQAIFTCSDKIDSMYKRMCNISLLLLLLHITTYLFIWHVNALEWYRCSFYPLSYSSGLWKSLFRAV